MPNPKKGEKQQDFISRCVPVVMDDGTAKDNKQAHAVCRAMWDGKNKAKGAMPHNSKCAKSECAWSTVDKAKLPDGAFADKKERSYPHHWVSGGSMHLHSGGLSAALAAANGARSGQEAPDAVKAHLSAHKKAMAMMELDSTLPEDVDEILLSTSSEVGDFDYFGFKEESSASGEESGDEGSAGPDGDTDAQPAGRVTNQRGVAAMPEGKEELRKDLEALWAEKDAKAKVEAKIGALEADKVTLSKMIATEQAEKAALEAKVKEAEAKTATQTQAGEDASKKVTDLEAQIKVEQAKAADLTAKLNAIEAEKALAKRSEELSKAGLLMPEGEKREKQMAKVKAMSDADYEVYKTEMTDIVQVAKASAAAPGQPPATPPAPAEGTPEYTAAQASAGIPPPVVSDGEKFQQAIAAVGFKGSLDEGAVNKYAQM
jgi:uncharacterized coiled-coil protein SlyX